MKSIATTKIWVVRDNLGRVLDYAENHLKTANPDAYTAAELRDLRDVLDYAASTVKTQFYVSGVNCIAESAYSKMTATKERFGKTGGNLAYHAYQSFAPNEVTPERCHKLGVELARRLWGSRYVVLVSTHLNTRCVHNHFVVNSVSFVDGKKLDNNFAMYFDGLRRQSDALCREYGLSVIDEPDRTSGGRYMRQAEQCGEPTLYNIVRSDIDTAIKMSMTPRQFYRHMRDFGYSFQFSETRKYPTLRPPRQHQNIRFKTLGVRYTPDAIDKRVLANQYPQTKRPYKPTVAHFRVRRVKWSRGLYAMYLQYVLLVRRINSPSRPQRTVYTPELRAAIRQIRKVSAETRLLCREKIETPEQLATFIERRNSERKELEHERGRVYNRMKSAKSPEKLHDLKEERDDLSAQIKSVRTDLYHANDVFKHSHDVERRLRAQKELEIEKKKEIDKNDKRKNDRSR